MTSTLNSKDYVTFARRFVKETVASMDIEELRSLVTNQIHEEIENAPWVLQAIWMAFEEKKHLIGPDVGDIQLNQIQINLTTKDHIGGLHVDIHDGTEAYTMVYSVCGDSGMDFWSNNPEHINPRIAELADKATRGEATQEEVEEEMRKTKERASAEGGLRTKDATWYADDFSNHEGELVDKIQDSVKSRLIQMAFSWL